jgi:hypothetical protein
MSSSSSNSSNGSKSFQKDSITIGKCNNNTLGYVLENPNQRISIFQEKRDKLIMHTKKCAFWTHFNIDTGEWLHTMKERSDGDHVQLLGGKVDIHGEETITDGLIREISEETTIESLKWNAVFKMQATFSKTSDYGCQLEHYDQWVFVLAQQNDDFERTRKTMLKDLGSDFLQGPETQHSPQYSHLAQIANDWGCDSKRAGMLSSFIKAQRALQMIDFDIFNADGNIVHLLSICVPEKERTQMRDGRSRDLGAFRIAKLMTMSMARDATRVNSLEVTPEKAAPKQDVPMVKRKVTIRRRLSAPGRLEGSSQSEDLVMAQPVMIKTGPECISGATALLKKRKRECHGLYGAQGWISSIMDQGPARKKEAEKHFATMRKSVSKIRDLSRQAALCLKEHNRKPMQTAEKRNRLMISMGMTVRQIIEKSDEARNARGALTARRAHTMAAIMVKTSNLAAINRRLETSVKSLKTAVAFNEAEIDILKKRIPNNCVSYLEQS